MKRIILLIAVFTSFWHNVHAQAAPDLGILWQKEYQGIDLQCAKFSHDGQLIYFASDTRIGILNAETGELLPGFDLIMDFAAEDLNITEDGKFLAVTTGSSTTYILNTVTKELVKEFSEKTLPSVKIIYHSDISPDGNFLYLSILGEDNYYYILIYSLMEDKEIKRLMTEGHVSKIKTSHDGKYFAAGITYKDLYQKWFNKLILWETGTWKEEAVLEDIIGQNDGYRHIKFSPNNQYIGSVRFSPSDAHIFDLNTKKLINTSEKGRLCGNVEFLPNNIHFLISYFTWGTEFFLELNDMQQKIKILYPIYGYVTESYDSNGKWKIYCTDSYHHILFTNQPISVLEFNPDNEINLFYDNGKIIIETANLYLPELDITITDITGKTVYQEKKSIEKGNTRYTIDIELTSGIYLAKVIAGNKNYSFKIEVTR